MLMLTTSATIILGVRHASRIVKRYKILAKKRSVGHIYGDRHHSGFVGELSGQEIGYINVHIDTNNSAEKFDQLVDVKTKFPSNKLALLAFFYSSKYCSGFICSSSKSINQLATIDHSEIVGFWNAKLILHYMAVRVMRALTGLILAACR